MQHDLAELWWPDAVVNINMSQPGSAVQLTLASAT